MPFRRSSSAVLVLALLGLAPGVRSQPVALPLTPPGLLASSNVEYVATIPIDSPGVGGKVLRVGDQTRFYVTGAKGLTIYDVTNPALPLVLGHMPQPHFQNEDVDVSDDGRRVIISADTTGTGIRVIDTSDPANIKRGAISSDSSHTVTCADPACEWLYSSNGRIYDARNNRIARAGRWTPGGGHALNRDAAGLLVSDSNPRLVLDVSDPAAPVVLTTGAPSGPDGFLQHNNVRPDAELWTPRAAGDTSLSLRPGELLIGNSESNDTVTCRADAGGLSTWSMADFNRGRPMQQLHTFRPVSGRYVDTGDPPVNGLGCSGHWFTVRDGYVAAGWYEHGTRFFEVDPVTGAIDQLGFFQPVATSASAAHWIDDTYVYSVDYARGIDILRFHRDGPVPPLPVLNASWRTPSTHPASVAERYACRVDGV